MIKFANQVPSVYPSASRDFQFLCWLMDIVLNSVKHNVDDLYYLPDNKADPKLIELMATTLGFKVKRNYDQAQFRALVVALPRILRNKGTKVAIDMAGKALLAASGASGSFRSEVKNGELYVVFPETLVDVALFNDLLTYILPAGMTCHIARTDALEVGANTEVNYSDKLQASWQQDFAWDDTTLTVSGLTKMFDVPASDITVANFKTDGITTNIGLLDNNVIPILENKAVYKPNISGTTPDEPDYTEELNDFGTTAVINKYTVDNNDDGDTVIIGMDDK
jgi:hypothetical protein